MMKTSNIYLRVAFGIAIISFFMPFIHFSAFLMGEQTVSGFAAAAGTYQTLGGGKGVAIGELSRSLLVLIIGFAFSFRKKPLGRWIGILPLVPALSLSQVLGTSSGNGFAGIQWGVGVYICFLASLTAAIIGFIGRDKIVAPPAAQVPPSQSVGSSR